MKRVLRSLAGLLAMAVTLTGCRQSVDLSAVRALAQEVGSSADAFSSLSGDFYGSCVRAYDWRWSGALSHATMKPISQACATSATASHQWQNANLILIEYIQALGNVAGGGDSETDFGIPALVSSVSNVTNSGLTQDQVTTIGSAGTSIVTDVFNIRRRNELGTYVPQANAHLSKLIDTLEQVAQVNYAFQLDLEQEAIDHFYVAVVPPPGAALQVRPARRTGARIVRDPVLLRTLLDVDKVQILTLRQSYEKERRATDDRRRAIDAYFAALEAIRTVHNQLTASIASNRASDVANIVQAYIDEYRPEVNAISAAFAAQRAGK